ncbi:MAG: diheme cytochrome c-553 [Acidobacteriota bacterium]
MSSRKVSLCLSVLLYGALVWSCGQKPSEVAAETPAPDPVKRGEYLVSVAGCNDCHTPKVFTEQGPEPDRSRLLSGHPEDCRLPSIDPARITPDGWLLFNNQLTATVGPWGISFAANITSDEETGIGRWTEDAFITTLRTGKHWGVGPAIVPPMPWQNLALMPDEDLKAIFAYLKSTPPVRNHVPAAMTLEEYLARVKPDGTLPRP